ncbi:MAG: hypothetical protein PHE50_03910 [Dehalococcoidales bacterium]|nr:hypothetical protein [Dehalococcoidales bacterium]
MRKIIVSIVFCLLMIVTGVGNVAAKAFSSSLSNYDITSSKEGFVLAQETTLRWEKELGIHYDVTSVKVYKFGKEEFLVAPADANISLEAEMQSDGSIKITPIVDTPKENQMTGIASNSGGRVLTDYGWELVGSQAFSRFENSTGWIDHAYMLDHLTGESDPNYDYYSLHHYATAKSKGIFILRFASLECAKTASSSTMYWVDWCPRSDQTWNNPTSYTLSVTAGGYGLSYNHTGQDTWDITKYEEAGKFKNIWYGSAWGSEREVAYMVCVKVPQNGWPQWSLTADFGCPW